MIIISLVFCSGCYSPAVRMSFSLVTAALFLRHFYDTVFPINFFFKNFMTFSWKKNCTGPFAVALCLTNIFIFLSRNYKNDKKKPNKISRGKICIAYLP